MSPGTLSRIVDVLSPTLYTTNYGPGWKGYEDPNAFAEEIIDAYNDMMPFAKSLYYDAQRLGSNRGWIKTMGGRYRRFNKWEPFVPYKLQQKPSEALQAFMTEY